MATVLQANPRGDLRGSTTRKIRKDGYVPAVIYGSKTKSKPVLVERVELVKTIRDVGKNGLFSLNIEGESNHQVMVYDIQIEPLKNDYLHVDFFEVDMESEIVTDVAVRLEGEAPGEKEGGVVSHLLYDLSVRCLPGEIPEEVVVNISNLAIGDSIQVADIRSSINVEIANDDEETIVTVQAAAAEVEPEGTEVEADNEPEATNDHPEAE
ncbi:50S ribosomal protein L25/general stress protein Ctc [Bacillus sp. JCM 19034]|uniref:50S ribosomal protein L25/general stress protein Ctc n=1 Tax=Bacillus sp. JCM 19034 TaxID=1481928 RepID=UPI000781B2E1|nr:50S ribosomal protein L25/general stress protein Ctc [Bacillus sp. JCM 19034]